MNQLTDVLRKRYLTDWGTPPGLTDARALHFIRQHRADRMFLAEHLELGNSALTAIIAERLVENDGDGYLGFVLVAKLTGFKERERPIALAHALDNYDGWNSDAVLLALAASRDCTETIAMRIRKFQPSQHAKIAGMLREAKPEDFLPYLDEFQNLTPDLAAAR